MAIKKAKPILIIGVPIDIDLEIHLLEEKIKNKMNDYHVIWYRGLGIKDLSFQVFYEKDFNEVKYDELKRIVKDSINGKA